MKQTHTDQAIHHINQALHHTPHTNDTHSQAARTHALLAITDALTQLGTQLATAFPHQAKPAPQASSPDWPRFREIHRASLPGETPGIRLLTCECGSNRWARYPARHWPDGEPLNWWVDSNPECFRVVDVSHVMLDGTPDLVFVPGDPSGLAVLAGGPPTPDRHSNDMSAPAGDRSLDTQSDV